MNQTKPNVISFKGTDQTKKEIETAAANLGMTSSELIRTAIDQYIGTEIKTAQAKLLSRAEPYMTHGDPTKAITEIEKLMDGMTLSGMKTWGSPEITPEDTFKLFVELKVKTAGVGV